MTSSIYRLALAFGPQIKTESEGQSVDQWRHERYCHSTALIDWLSPIILYKKIYIIHESISRIKCPTLIKMWFHQQRDKYSKRSSDSCIHGSDKRLLYLALYWQSHNNSSTGHLILAIDIRIVHRRRFTVRYFYTSSKWLDVYSRSLDTAVLLSNTPQW